MQAHQWSDTLYYQTKRGTEFYHHLAALHGFTRQVIKDRKAQRIAHLSANRDPMASTGSAWTTASTPFNQSAATPAGYDGVSTPRRAFLDLMIDHQLAGGQLTDEDMREEVDTFLFEGHDTTAMALSWILFLLGHHSEIQDRLHAEIDSVFEGIRDAKGLSKDGDEEDDGAESLHLNLDQLKELKFLEAVIKEGLRLCPSVPFIERQAVKDIEIAGYKVPSGSILLVCIHQIHRDPNIYPEPERFNPDRFMNDHTLSRHPFAFVPFSAGPRSVFNGLEMHKLKLLTS